MFAYYPLPGEGAGGGGALSIVIRPNPAEYYKPSVYYTASKEVRCIITGGTAPYTVAWTFVSGDTQIYPAGYDGDENIFYADAPGDSLPHVYQAVWRATVTDAASATANTTVSVLLAFGTQPP